MQLIDGKAVASSIQERVKSIIFNLRGRKPGLAVILVGDHLPSQTYVKMKRKACLEAGILSSVHHLPSSISQESLLKEIDQLNQDNTVDGILVQLPLPPHIDSMVITEALSPAKDVDGLHPYNMGKLLLGQGDGFVPCTPGGIMVLMEKNHVHLNGKHVVILGRSNLVGKPLAALLIQKTPSSNATVTIAHRATRNLKDVCLQADVLIAAIGHAHFVKQEMIKEGVVIIDVGINQMADPSSKTGYKLVGDVDFEDVKAKCSAITPVPGGVGPMTIAQLISNTLLSYQKREQLPHD